jgi:hypothetical protein
METKLNELALILRGDHKGWQGDRRMNAYSFLMRMIIDSSKEAYNLGLNINSMVMQYANNTGISPNTLRQISSILLRQSTQGML